MSGQPTPPRPQLDDSVAAPFWAGTRTQRLLVQRCPVCGYLRWPPGVVCPECLTRGGEWTQVRPTGVLWSFAVYHRALDPSFADDVPYTVGLVQLDEGPRMYGRMTRAPQAEQVGARVHAVFIEASDHTAVRWEVTDG